MLKFLHISKNIFIASFGYSLYLFRALLSYQSDWHPLFLLLAVLLQLVGIDGEHGLKYRCRNRFI